MNWDIWFLLPVDEQVLHYYVGMSFWDANVLKKEFVRREANVAVGAWCVGHFAALV